MSNERSSRRCPKCGCANGHNCDYERCLACRQRAHAHAEIGSAPVRASLSDHFLAAA